MEKAYVPGFNLFVTLLAARLFSSDELGSLAFLFIFSIWGSFIISRGTDQNLQVAYASCETKNLDQAVFYQIKLRLIRLWFLPLIFLVQILVENNFYEYAEDFRMISLGIFIGSISAIVLPNEVKLIVTHKFSILVFFKYLSGLVALLLCGVLSWYFDIEFYLLIFLLIIERLIYLFFTIYQIRNELSRPLIIKDLVPVPKINIFVLGSAISIFCYNRVDQIYIYTIFSKSELGQYFLCVRIFEFVLLFLLAQINSNLAVLADTRKPILQTTKIERRLFWISVVMCLLTLLITPLIVNFIFGLYIENYSFLIHIFLGTLFACIGSIKGPWVSKNNRFYFNLRCTFLGGIFALAYLFLFEPQNIIGVAFSFAFGQFMVNVFFPLFSKVEREFIFNLITFKKRIL